MKKWKVLVVTDDNETSQRIRSILKRSHYRLLPSVESSSNASASIRSFTPDIVLISLTLRGNISGRSVAHTIASAADLPIVYLVSEKDRKKFLLMQKKDPSGFIMMPFVDIEVYTVIEMAIHRHAAERARKEQHQWLDTTLRSIGDGVIATDKKGRVKFMNTIAETLTGWNEKEAIGKKLTTVFRIKDESTGEKPIDPVSKVLSARTPVRLTNHTLLRSRNGTEVVIEDSAAPIFDNSEEIVGVVLTFRDVTQERVIQEEAQKSKERFRTLIEKSAEAVSIIDKNGIVRFTTSVTTTILGYETSELLGTNAFERIHPDDLEKVRQLFSKIIGTQGIAGSTVFRYRNKNDDWMWLEATGTNLLHDPSINGIIVNYRDIGYRKIAEEKLNLINKRLDLISRVTGEVIGTMPLQKQAASMADLVRDAFQVDAVVVRTLNDDDLTLLASTGIPNDLLVESIPAQSGIGEKILSTRRAMAFTNIRKELPSSVHRRQGDEKPQFEFLSYAGAPMLIGHTIIGVIGIFTVDEERTFSKTDLEHLQIVANHISVAIANNRLFREIREHNLEMTKHIEEQTRVERLLRISEERYKAFVKQSTEGIYRTAFDQPIPLSLPVEEQIRLMFDRGYIAECNAVMAMMYGFDRIDQAIGKRIKNLLMPTDPHNIEYMRTFISSGYKFFDQESHEKDNDGNVKYFLNNGIGIVEDGMWWGVWGTQRDITERKSMEERLKVSERTYRELINNVNEAIYIQDENGCFLDVNATAERFYGYHRNEFIGKTAEFLSAPGMNDLDEVGRKFRKAFNGEPQFFEFYGRRKDGTIFPKDVSLTSGDYFGKKVVIAVGRDITERKRAEEALQESELRFRSLFENAKDAVFIADTKTGVVIDANEEAEKLLKKTRREIIGMHQSQIHPPERVDEALNLFREQMLILGEHAVEFEVVDAQGKHIPVEIKSSVIRLDEERMVMQGIFRDITDRKIAEEALRKSEEKYRSLFEGSKDGIYISTHYGKFIDVNPAMVELLGYGTKEEVLDLDIQNSVYFHPVDREKFKTAIANRSFIKDLELSLCRKDGSMVNVLITSTVERSGDGTPLFYSGTIRDITERKRLEQQLIQAQKMESIGTLAGGIAHDFNNLLAMILGTAEMIKRKSADNPAIASYVKRIIEASERGASISKQLLLFSKPEQAELQPVSISSAVEQLREFLGHFLPKNITIDCIPHPTSAVIMGDSGHIHQALVNLAINGRDAMPDGGTLSVRVDIVKGGIVRSIFPAAENREYIAVKIADTGLGIDAQHLRRIFEPFFSTKERGKGTGLGLSIVHGIVKLHNGHIHVDSEIGKGTTFTIFLPSLAIEMPAIDEKNTQPDDLGKETILVVDDEEILREILKESLMEHGYDVLSAADGEEAFQIYLEHRERISLVITDLGMPIMNGEQLFMKMKEKDPNIKVIVSSGFLDTSNKSELLRKGIKDVLTKPFKINVIFDTIHRVLQSE
jgi:PAS domain S-box-containing protein